MLERQTETRYRITRTRLQRVIVPWALAVIFVGFLAYLVLVPLYHVQSLALQDGGRGYSVVLSSPRLPGVIRTTVMLAVFSLAIALVLGTSLAWLASRLPSHLRVIAVLPILPIVIPAVASTTGWAFLLSPRPGYINALLRTLPWWRGQEEGPVDIYSTTWIIILVGFGLASFIYVFVMSGLRNINSELLEAGQVSGSRPIAVFFRVTLPVLRPVFIYGSGVALLVGLGQFTSVLLLGRIRDVRVITTEMYRYTAESPIDYGAAAATASPLLLFGLAVVIFQKVLLGDQTRFVTHGGRSFRPARPSRWVAYPLLLYTFISTILPVGALAIVAFSRFWSPKISPSTWTTANFSRLLDYHVAREAIWNSISIPFFSVLIALPVGFLAASILVRGQKLRGVRSLLDFIAAVPLGIPAVLFGAGFLFMYTRPPLQLYGTRWVIILVYVTLMLPFTTRLQTTGLLALGNTYLEASRISGAGPVRTNLAVVFPLMRSAMGGAAALMFILLTHEFAASILVRSVRTQVMGTVLYDLWINGSYPQVAAMALIMSAVTAAGATIAVLLAGSDVLERI